MSCNLVILNFNDSKRALNLAKKCARFEILNKIIIVDNHSSDDSYSVLLKQKESKIEIIRTKYNGGFAFGNNVGANYAIEKFNPEFILFANTDTEFTERNVESCIKQLEKNKDLGLISMRMVDINRVEENSYWSNEHIWHYILSCFWIYRKLNYKRNNYATNVDDPPYLEVDVIRGSFMCFKSGALVDIDYFDESTFLYYEEDIIASRLKSKGYKIGLLTNQFYIHNHDYSTPRNEKFIRDNLNKSLLYFQKEYTESSTLEIYILKFSMQWSKVENYIISRVKNIIKRRKI